MYYCLSCRLLADVVLFSAIQFAFDRNADRKVKILRQMNTKTTWCFRIETNEYQSVIDDYWPDLFRYAKRGGNTGKSKLKLRKTSLTNVRNTSRWTWQEKDFKLKLKEASSCKMHALQFVFLELKAPAWKQTNFHTFSLVEKAHVTIKRKIRMCWTHGLPWELVETKWLTNTEDC